MGLRQMRCFLAVAEALHFGRAAQRFAMPPASPGRQIAQREAHLGATLIARATRHVALTPSGHEFAEAAHGIRARADALEKRIRAGGRQTASVLRIGAIDNVAAGLGQ